MFERSPDSLDVNSSEKTEAASPQLHLAIFDLANRAFVSVRFDTPALLVDESEQSTPIAGSAKRVESYHLTHPRYNLPPLKNMGFIPSGQEDVIVAAAKPIHERGVRFRDFALRRYNLEDLHAHVRKLNETGTGTPDTEILNTAFNKLPELRRFKAAS